MEQTVAIPTGKPDFTYRGPVVVFDLDDTLARERDYALSGFRHAARLLAGEELPQSLRTATTPEEAKRCMTEALLRRENHYSALEELLRSKGMMEEKVEELMKIVVGSCRGHIPDSGYRLRPDAAVLLERLQGQGVRMALVTDGRSLTQRRKIAALGLERFFAPEMIFISEERGAAKDSPASFEAIVRLLPEARRFFYVADNPAKDFLQPNLLGWETVCLLDTDSTNIHPQPSPKDFPTWPDGPSRLTASLEELSFR